jgi:hypothetical protein
MKKVIITSCIGVAGLLILISSGFFGSLMLFVMVGAIPGTNTTLSPSTMLLIFSGLVALLLVRLTAMDIYYATTHRRIAKQIVERKKRMPKRRFSQI